jgi:uncharacterized protein YbbC (DUF1343 family)
MDIKFFVLFILSCSFMAAHTITPGAERTNLYIDSIKKKENIAIVCNQTSVIGKRHLVDSLLALNIKINLIFAPEHGFRGEADAGSKVKNGMDTRTGIPIRSLYGNKKKPSAEDLKGIDFVIFDIQDVGVRFYTYISTMQYVMEACADNNIPMMILDRPSPNGFYIDGPVLDPAFASFVGMQSVPVVYGMTIGEYAQMLVGEKWCHTQRDLKLFIVKCKGYDHKSLFAIKIPPSPNLRSHIAINLYPSLCLFEGTNVSVGRGTDRPFELYGSPFLSREVFSFSFTPISKKGATNPPFLARECFGEDLSEANSLNEFSLQYLLKAYSNWTIDKDSFFLKSLFFDKLAGTDKLRKQIISGTPESEIRKSWKPDIEKFKIIRKKYLLYDDFE